MSKKPVGLYLYELLKNKMQKLNFKLKINTTKLDKLN